MSGIKDQDRLEELRQRLYERGTDSPPPTTHELTDDAVEVSTTFAEPPQPLEEAPEPEPVVAPPVADPTMAKRRKQYRIKFILAAIGFFVLSVIVSSLFLISGNNVISGENITLAVNGPFTIGGGETLPLQVGITNDNTVPIESATLIVEYPDGTRSADELDKALFTERLSLETINTGETLNVPLRAVVFGEENDQKEVHVSIEYRVRGSNALFFKEADPLKFKISSSPIRLSVDSLQKVSSGQETTFTITVESNSPTPLSNVMVKADYPFGFDFERSNPDPDHAQNVWLLDTIDPEGSASIEVTGAVVGNEADQVIIDVTVGVPTERDPQNLASVFTTERIDFTVEDAFIDIDLRIDGAEQQTAVIDSGDRFTAIIEVTNTLPDTIYDGQIVVTLAGNAISKVDIEPRNGYYDSANNTITWDTISHPSLQELSPGERQSVTLTVEPAQDVNRTPQIAVDVAVEARRVRENRVEEAISGTASSIVKISSDPTLFADAGYNISVFSDSGPIPPEAEKTTSYTMSFLAQNGPNDITDVVVTASLPPYVSWPENTSGSGDFSYDANTRTIFWEIDTISANGSAFGTFQVVFKPSVNQIGDSPVIVGEQRLRATDRFTGATVRASSQAVTTELSEELGYTNGNGRVVE